LTPSVLGQLIATYEHAVFTSGVVWDINSFDQWGVELGKELARDLVPALEGEQEFDGDAATAALLARIRRWRAR
jgi:glucose-6-phosphate isomerase